MGFARVLRTELPSLPASVADLARPCLFNVSHLIRRWTLAEPEIALPTGGIALASRLRRAKDEFTSRIGCEASRTTLASTSVPDDLGQPSGYCFTGGLGGLALHAALQLARRGARWLLLASRSGRVARGEGQLQSTLDGAEPSAHMQLNESRFTRGHVGTVFDLAHPIAQSATIAGVRMALGAPLITHTVLAPHCRSYCRSQWAHIRAHRHGRRRIV